MARTASAALVLALAAATAACGSGLPAPRYFSEEPPGSQQWTEVSGVPEWVGAPPARNGMLRMVVEGRSNDRRVATSSRGLATQVRRRIAETLAPVVGAEAAARAAGAAAPETALVHRVSKDEVLTRDLVAGNTLSTVWTLCEVPLDAVLEPLPESERAAACDALAR